MAAPADRFSAGKPTLFVADLVRYGLCSAAALLVDWGLLIALVAGGVAPLAASATSFCAGMLLTYVLSIRVVYTARRSVTPLWEAVGFCAIGFAGLALNQALLAVFMSTLHLPAGLAKAPTVGFVFMFNFLARRTFLFSSKRRQAR